MGRTHENRGHRGRQSWDEHVLVPCPRTTARRRLSEPRTSPGPPARVWGGERAARSPDDPAVCTATRRAHGADFGVHRLPFEAAGERGPPASCLRAEAAPFTPLQRGDAGTSSGPLPEWRRPCHMQPPQASRGCANANHQMTENRKAGPSVAATLHVLRRPRGAVHR